MPAANAKSTSARSGARASALGLVPASAHAIDRTRVIAIVRRSVVTIVRASVLPLVLTTVSPAGAVDGLVATTAGPVQGVFDAAARVWAFRGIPYAAPPTGERRFARPDPAAPRSGTLLADTFPEACPQVAGALSGACSDGAAEGTIVGSEDCLALNVLTPAREWPASATRPVMVYIHGGAFEGGCERREETALAAKGDVVLVRIQYRLGLLGFLATEAMAAADPNGSAGNWGVLDMIQALRWVRANIAGFGGDPGNVTVFGESAGGVGVCALLASRLADDLFERAIIQSGHCQIARPLRTTKGSAIDEITQVDIGAAIAAELGCRGTGSAGLACLRSLPSEAIVAIQPELAGLGLGSLQATIDGYVLDEHPLSVLAARGIGDRELVIGSNRDEYSAVAVLDESLAQSIREDYESAVRAGLAGLGQVFRPLPLADLAAELLALYPDPIDPDARIESYSALFGELYGNCPVLDAAARVAGHGGEAFVYHFARRVPNQLPMLAALGAFHSMDLFYVFGNLAGLEALLFEPGPEDDALSDRMIEAWSGFARTGVPATAPPWPAWKAAAPAYFEWDADAADPVRALYRDGRCPPLRALLDSVDRDVDLVPDGADGCARVANASQLDRDRDGRGDRCDRPRLLAGRDRVMRPVRIPSLPFIRR
jgi:para-nitrobenzyl esterase